MPYYTVNATISFSAWIVLEANSEREAIAEAQDRDASSFDYDASTGEVDFNVTPMVELDS